MLNEELQNQILQTKLTYLNGYLNALELINSYSLIGMKYKLFAFNFSMGDIEKCIQNNAYELFGVYPNEYEIEVIRLKDWETKLKTELNSNLKRRIPSGKNDVFNPNGYSENLLVQDLSYHIRFANENFVNMIKNEFTKNNTEIYEVITKSTNSLYRIIGIDLIFEIEPSKILYLQILGND